MKLKLFFVLYLITISFVAQNNKRSKLVPFKIGLLYNYGNENNFIFDDKDYYYTTNTIKAQAFYNLGSWKSLNFELVVQPQVQFLKHQLLNEWYVTPDQENYKEKIAEFIQPKNMYLYGVEFGFSGNRELFPKLNLQASISLGFAYINTRTERLSKGFTFIENFSLGFSYEAFTNNFFYLGSNFGHVSNLNFQLPNDGYNILGIEVGYSFKL